MARRVAAFGQEVRVGLFGMIHTQINIQQASYLRSESHATNSLLRMPTSLQLASP